LTENNTSRLPAPSEAVVAEPEAVVVAELVAAVAVVAEPEAVVMAELVAAVAVVAVAALPRLEVHPVPLAALLLARPLRPVVVDAAAVAVDKAVVVVVVVRRLKAHRLPRPVCSSSSWMASR
jgi:hypothetical protein